MNCNMDINATVYSDARVNFTNNSSSNHLKIHKHKSYDSLGICSHAIRNDCHLFNIDQIQKSPRHSSLFRTKTINDSISPTKEKREFFPDTGLNTKQLYNEMVGITSDSQNLYNLFFRIFVNLSILLEQK